MEEKYTDGAATEPTKSESQAATETISPATDTNIDQKVTEATTKQKSETKKNIFIVVTAVLIVSAGVAGYFLIGEQGSRNTIDVESETSRVIDIAPDAIVARVNDAEISGDVLLYQMLQVAQVTGIPSLDAVDSAVQREIRDQALDAIVNTEILLQNAENAGFSIEPEEVDSEYASIVAEVGGAEVAAERFVALGTTEEAFKANLESELLIRKYVENQTDLENVVVTDEEVTAFYEEATGGATENVPPFEDVRFQIENQLAFQKEQEIVSELLNSLRQGADIELLVE